MYIRPSCIEMLTFILLTDRELHVLARVIVAATKRLAWPVWTTSTMHLRVL